VPPDAKEGFRTHETLILSMAVRMELADAGRKEPFARLIAGWTAARSDQWVRAHAIETAREFGLAAMVSVVRQIASDNQTEARFRAPAITLLAELGGQDERPLLRQLLGNGGECYSRKLTIKGEDAPTATAQIRDVALGCLLIRDGVDLQTAGFDELDYLYREPLKPHEYFRLSPFGFFSAEKRNAAHAKFAALRMPDAPPGNSPKAAADQAAELKRLRQFAIQHRIGAIACSANGELIAITNSDVTFPLTADWKPVVEVLDATTGKTLASLPLATDAERELIIKTEGLPHFEVGPLAFSPDGKVLAVSTGLGQVKLFNARSGELIRSLDDEKARLAEAKSPEKFKTFPRAMGAVRSLAFSPEGNLLAIAGASFDETSWDLIERGGLGKRSSSGPGRLKVWDIKTGELKHDLAGHSQVFGVAFAPDGSWLASVGRWSTATSEGNGLLLWDLKTQAIHRTIMIDANGSTHAVVFSPQKKLAAIGSIQFDKENDTRSSRIQLAYPLSGITEWKQTIDGGALPRAFLPDGKQLVALCERKSIRFFDVETGQMKREIKAADSAAGGIWVELAVAQQAGIMVIAGATHESRGLVEIWGAADRHDE
jgi:WD40 repeat protein